MAHADWLISGLEKSSCPLKKFIMPARENIVQINFKANRRLPYAVHSVNEFYYRVSFTILKKQMTQMCKSERFSSESVFLPFLKS